MSSRRTVALVALVAMATQGCASTAPSTVSSGQAEQPPTRVEVKSESAGTPASPQTPTAQAPPGAGAPSSSPPPLSVGPQRTPPPPREVPPSPTSTVSPPPPPPALPGAPSAGTPVPGPPPAGRRFVVFNFDNADVEVVVQAASEIAGFSYVVAPAARGKKVTVQTQGRIASDEVLGVLLTILDVNGLAAVRTGNLYRIIPREGAPQSPVRTIVGRELPDTVAADEIVSQVVPLQYVGATEMAALLRPFVPAQGGLAPHPQTNLLIVTDTAANIRRLLEMIKLTDVQVALEEIQIVALKYADAQEMAQLLTQLFASGRLRATAAAAALGIPPAPPTAPGGAGPTAPPRPVAPASAQDADRAPLIVAERRSNSLVIHAGKQEMGTIRRLIDQLDIDLYGGQRVFIHFAENTKAKDLASTLDAIYGKGTGPAVTGTQSGVGGAGISTTGTGRTGSPYGLPTTTTTGAGTTTGRTTGSAGRTAALAGDEGSGAAGDVRFIADEVTNAVIVTTYPRSWKEIEETIKRLDKMPRQVLVEVLAAEVTLTDDMRLGIEWAIRSGRFDLTLTEPTGSVGILPARPPRNLIPLGGDVGVAPGLNLFTFAADKFLAALNALAVENKVNVLSNPSIMTTENKKAVINVSRSVPILT